MAENEVHFDYTLSSRQAQSELEKVREQLQGITAAFNGNVQAVEKNIARLSKLMADAMKRATEAGGVSLARAEATRDRLEGGVYNRLSQGSPANAANRAAAQAQINDIVNTTQALQSRVTDTIIKTSLQQLRTAESMITARIKAAHFNAGQSVANSSDRYLSARANLAEQRRQDTIFAAENGRAALTNRNRLESLNHNGGADLMGIQGRVMLNYAAVGGIFNAVRSTLSGVVELDKELHQFQAISTATNREMVDFKKNLLDISATVPFTTLEMTKAATSLAQAGLSTAEVTQSLESVTKFATATGSELSQAVDVITSSLTAFNLETTRTGDVANTFTAALNLSKLSVDKMVTALNYIGPTANEVGLTLEETTSVLGALSQSGIRASTMGTGFRSLLTDLQSPSKKLIETLTAAGLSVDDVNVKTKGFLPVIENLKNAGFGAAQAYETLELRSAAAYVALSNNTELAYELQRSFILSAAATEANDIQMKSLANTAKNFGSAFTASAYTAFEPLLGLMQSTLEGVTDLMVGLNQVPGLLKTIGVAATALGTIMTASLGLSLLRSLGTMIPVLGSIRMGIGLMATEALAASGVLAGVGAALRVLTLIPVGGWIGLAATAAIAAATAFYSWSDSSKDISQELDELRGRTNQLVGAADASAKKVASIEQAIQGVIDRKDELEDNELMRGAKIDELRHQFAELGLSIKDDTLSVTDLIRELHDLKQTSSSIRAAELAEANASRALEIKKLEEQQALLLKQPDSGLDRALTFLEYGRRRAVPDQGNRDWLVDQAAGKFPAVADAIRFANRDMSVVGDEPLAAAALSKIVNAEIDRLTLNPTATSERDIEFLRQLKEVLDPLVQNITQLAVARDQADKGIQDEQKARIESSKAYKQLDTSFGRIKDEYNTKAADLRNQGLTAEQELKALDALEDWLTMMTDDAIETFRRSFERDGRVNMLDAEPTAREFRDRMEALGLSSRSQETEAKTRQRKLLEKEARKEESKQSAELARLRRDITGAPNKEALDAAKKAYTSYLETSTEALKDHYARLIEVTSDPDALETRREELAHLLEELGKDANEVDKQAIEKEQDLLKESLQRQKEALTDSAKGIRSKIDLAIDELKRTPPSAAMDALVKKIKELTGQLTGELSKIGSIDTQLSSINLGEPISAATAGNGQSAMQHFLSRGLSKAGAAAIAGNIAVESNFNPTAKGDFSKRHQQYTAFGAGQWRFDRWDDMRSFAGRQGKSEWDLTTQYDFFLDEMSRKHPELLRRLQTGNEDVQTLTRDFMRQYENPSHDPSKNHIAKRLSYAESFATSDVAAGQAEVTKIAAETEKVVTDNQVRSVKAIADATIKNLNSRLGTLKTQARLNDDATSIQDIQKQVQDAHAKIMEEELKKFDAENADSLALPDVQNQRKDLQDRLRENLNNDILKVMNEYYKAADEELNRPIDAAKAQLDAARAPDMANKFTQADIQRLEQNVVDREREAAANRILLIEQQIADVRQRAADAERGGDTESANMWRLQENDLIAKNNALKEQNNALDAVKASQGPSVAQGIQSATNAWAQQNGILDAANQMVPLGKQVEQTWGGVLDGLSSGFSSFFSNITSGTMSAKDALKQLGLSILDMFTQIIAKALANQIIMSLFGGGKTGGSSIFGSLAEGLFGIVGGAATGGAVRAANGRVVRGMANGGSPFRDSRLYNLMDGEYVLRQSAVQAIGVDKLDAINNLGNRQISEGALKGKAANQNDKQGSGMVNVWVVSPDQVPPAGPNDIIATVADNIQRRGTIKQLIQSVQMGAI